MNANSKRLVVGLAFGLVTVAASHSTRADMSYYVNQGGNVDFSGRDIDFTSASIPVSPSGITAGRKMLTVQLATNNNKSLCLDVGTSGDGTGDTMIWIGGSNGGDYVRVTDDIGGGNFYSKTRVWIATPTCNPGDQCYSYLNLYVTGYNTSYNSMKFSLDIWKYAGITTEAGCTSGTTVKKIGSADAFVVNPT